MQLKLHMVTIDDLVPQDHFFTGIDTSLGPNGHTLPLWFLTILFTYIIGTYRMLGLEYEHHDKALSEFAGLFCNKGL